VCFNLHFVQQEIPSAGIDGGHRVAYRKSPGDQLLTQQQKTASGF
jgi:hypothetical protein